jgi:hypothetical protein
MGFHPLNLALRFILELSALTAVGFWGWRQTDSWFRYVLAMGIPVGLAIIWGVFAVPDDKSRSGAAPIPTPGFVRLLLELGLFAFATWSLYNSGFVRVAWVLAIVTFSHYLISYDRIEWLLKH